MKGNSQYKNWSKAKLIEEILRLKKGKNKIKKTKIKKEKPKKIRKKIKKSKLKKIRKIEKKPQKIKKLKIKPEIFEDDKNKYEKEKLERLNEWFLKAKEEHPEEIISFKEFKDSLKKSDLEKIVSIKELQVKDEKKPAVQQPEPIQKTEKTEPIKPAEDKTMEKIRENLEKISEKPNQKKPLESALKRTIGLLNEGIADFKEEQQIKKIEKLKIKCRYKILAREYEVVINKTLKEFDEKHPLSDEVKNVIDDVKKNKSPNLQGLTDSQKEELSKFIKERKEHLRKRVNIWFKQLGTRFSLTSEEVSLLAHLINNDFPYK